MPVRTPSALTFACAPQPSRPLSTDITRGTWVYRKAKQTCYTRSSQVSHICCSYQRDVEERASPKVPSSPPPPSTTTRRPPPPPPPPPPPAAADQPAGQTRRNAIALLGIGAVAFGYNISQHPESLPVPAGPATVKSAEVYANSALRPTRVWPSGSPENPFTQVIYWHKSPYARLKKDGWMRVCGMQSGKGGKVEMILEARGGNQYTLEVPLRQVRPWDMKFMNALFNSLIDWDSHLRPFDGKIKNRNLGLE